MIRVIFLCGKLAFLEPSFLEGHGRPGQEHRGSRTSRFPRATAGEARLCPTGKGAVWDSFFEVKRCLLFLRKVFVFFF